MYMNPSLMAGDRLPKSKCYRRRWKNVQNDTELTLLRNMYIQEPNRLIFWGYDEIYKSTVFLKFGKICQIVAKF